MLRITPFAKLILLYIGLVATFSSIYGQTPSNLSNSIKVGNMDMEVEDYKKVRNSIQSIMDSNGGIVYEEKENNFSTKIENRIILRIPTNDFDKATNEIAKLASKISIRNVRVLNSSDETSQINKKIAIKQEVKRKYATLIEQTKLTMEIERAKQELEKVNTEIEALESRLSLIQENKNSELSLIIIQYYTNVIKKIDNSSQFTDMQKPAMSLFLRRVLYFTIIPLIIFVIGYFLFQHYKQEKRRKKRGSKSPW